VNASGVVVCGPFTSARSARSLVPMRRPSLSVRASFLAAACVAAALSVPERAHALTPEERTARSEGIRDVAADNGISAGYLLAGIANAETRLSHCWSELTWACEGPSSPDCSGPVVAGAGDGPCSLMEGGLGMFQFDGGTFDETIARDGDGVLLLSGNTTKAVDFVVDMVMRSVYADANSPAEAKAWLNEVTVDGPLWDAWITTVTHYYNGCVPGSCGVFDQRYQHYDDSAREVFDEQGAAFWDVALGACDPIAPEGALLEETDTCFTKGGPLPYWRVGIGGESNLHVWTGTTADTEAVNFAEWSLNFAEAGRYLVEVSAPNATSTQATYVVDRAGTSEGVVLDQSTADGFAPLGEFEFAEGGEQRVFVGDNTGEADGRKLVADALRLTRLDLPGPTTAGAGGAGGGGDGGAGGAGGADDGGGGATGEATSDNDEGCACRTAGATGADERSPRAALAAVAIAIFARRRRRDRKRASKSARGAHTPDSLR
jgi:hypothetical protein